MIKDFSLSRNNALINFTQKYCETEKELLDSNGFKKVLEKYIKQLERLDAILYDYFINMYDNKNELVKSFQNLFKLLIVLDIKEVSRQDIIYRQILRDKSQLIEFIEGLYNYWRTIDRYAIIRNRKQAGGIQNVNFIDSTNNFTNLVLKVYRQINESVIGKKHNVYRQLAAGINAGIIVNDSTWESPKEYHMLKDITFIESIILRPPFITYPKKYKRKGTFEEYLYHPYESLQINADHWFCYPAKVGEYLAFVYFHRDFMVHGVTLCNLFELAEVGEYRDRQPDLIYVFGARDKNREMNTGYYYDKENDVMVGYANKCEDLDYFGYMKKMLLTLHNLRQIDSNNLPIHGAMVNVILKDGTESNIVIIGDSGAGKSESLEAFRFLSQKYLKAMKIIFDDMGVFKIKNNKVSGYGTEIGAFVRLDDLENGYAYKEMDRSVFMNPDKINARLVMPVSTYADIMRGYKVDIVLYANNFEDSGEVIEFFDCEFEAVEVFKQGARRAKGTTNEKGIVTSYFANPFGPLQKQSETDILLEIFFGILYETNVKVGQIYTQLAIEGKERSGPIKAAQRLFDLIKK
ncbi:phosphoenolpyruvate carboxykinase [Mycoplasmatota bacterium WC44]